MADATIGILVQSPVSIGGLCVELADGTAVPFTYARVPVDVVRIRAELPEGVTTATVAVRETDGVTLSPCGDGREVVFSVPEPGVALALVMCAFLLMWLRKRRE